MATAKRTAPASPNIYTVLAVVATLVLGFGVGIVINFSSKLTGQSNPWYVEPKTANQQSVVPPAQ